MSAARHVYQIFIKADPDEVTNWQLAQAAESIKVSLSTRDEYEELSLIGAGVRASVTRRDFEQK